MSKLIKDMMTDEYRQRFQGKDHACVVSVIRMDAISANKFRGELTGKQLQMQVVKNSLARRAFTETPLEPLGKALEGPCAVVVSEEDATAIDMAKVLVDFKKAYPALELKIGILEGDTDLMEVEQLAKMKGRLELLADIAGCIASPGRKLAGCLAGPGGRIAGCLKAMADKEGE